MTYLRHALLLAMLTAAVTCAVADAAPHISVGLRSTAITTDTDGDGRPDPGDRIRFEGTVANTSDSVATSVTITIPNDPNLHVDAARLFSNPIAIDDSLETDADTALIIPEPGILANDFDLPQPANVVVAGTTITAVAGTVTVTPEGRVVYEPQGNFDELIPGQSAMDVFCYTVRDAQDNYDTATVTIAINGVNDAPLANAQTLTTDEDTAVEILLTGSDVDAGTTLSFAVASLPAEGSLGPITVLSDSTAKITFTPGEQFQNLAEGQERETTFSFKVNDGTLSSVPALVTLTVQGRNDAPVAVADQYLATGNTTLVVGRDAGSPGSYIAKYNVISDLLTNDSDVDEGDIVSVVAETVDSVKGGMAIIHSNGSFFYYPPAGLSATEDTFTYKVTDGEETVPQTVSITLNGKVWFIHNGRPGSLSTGTSHDPFTTLADFSTANDPADETPAALRPQDGDVIYLAGTGTEYPGTMKLRNNQQVTGSRVTLNRFGLHINGGGTAPVVTNSFGNGIELGSDNIIEGLDVIGTSGVAIYGTAVGNLEIADCSIINTGSNGPALNLTGSLDATAWLSFHTLSSGTGGDNGIALTNINGGLITIFGTLEDSAGANLLVNNGKAGIVYRGDINNATGHSIHITNKTGGDVSFYGNILDTGSGIYLDNNPGTTFIFTGTITLNTGPNNGFIATGGGTLRIDGSNNTISCAGTALKVQNTSFSDEGVTFKNISSVGGSATGIILDGTGSRGRLRVTGTGGPASGGTISNKSGADGDNSTGVGIYLNNTWNPSFLWMQLNDFSNYAIRGSNVADLTFDDGVINGINGTNVNLDEGAISFENLTGAAYFRRCAISGGAVDNVRIANTSGTLQWARFSGCHFGSNGIMGNSTVQVIGSGDAVMDVYVDNSVFTASRVDHLSCIMRDSALGTIGCGLNTMTNNHVKISGESSAVSIASSSTGEVGYSVGSNSISGSVGTAIEVNCLAGGAGKLTGSIRNNKIGTSGVPNSGSRNGSAIVVGLIGDGTAAEHMCSIRDNIIRQFSNYGISLVNRGTGAGYLNVLVRDNNIAEPTVAALDAFFPTSGIRAELGSSSSGLDNGRNCLEIHGNTVNQTAGPGASEVRIWGRDATKTALPYLGVIGPTDANLFISDNNNITLRPGGATPVNATSNEPFQSICPPQ